ncbi:glycosyltransferase [Acetobacter estunensis NRIC 0472]|uniref:Glycosyltransferase n=1 Tax=Acetobacter estunensis TaxID=104097 RepID=A0A967B5U4_9PROT|nr:glycosyltransferase family 2 protein [Acetobacter estunensis]NHO52751.1 glycosyltransferase [Acetobacter estunensis]GBQ28147.1 glycosyltransferase [Acetobacter estunensis NRIC 0472]
MTETMSVGVVIPSYKVTAHILDVISRIGPEVQKIYVVDDCCPDRSGDLVERSCTDARVTVVRHEHNQGVGGAVMTGYRAAIRDDVDVIVKIDGDGQMDPALVPEFVAPILTGHADYTKGNRFFNLEGLSSMPGMRLFGNAVLSFMTKISSGYWSLFDPTNGYTAIHRDVAALLPMERISFTHGAHQSSLFL